MNDPHVVALIYEVSHGAEVEYTNAIPLTYSCSAFDVNLDKGIAHFEFKKHFSSAEEARREVSDFIRSWELSASLKHGPDVFRLSFQRAEVIDRAPTPGVVELYGVSAMAMAGIASVTIRPREYPQPAPYLYVDADVEVMSYRYANYRRGSEKLPAVGYFCLTVLETMAGSRPAAAEMLKVSMSVLTRLGRLTTEKGGIHARKSGGRTADYTDSEREWIEALLPILIRRAAEVAFNPSQSFTEITMADLPSL